MCSRPVGLTTPFLALILILAISAARAAFHFDSRGTVNPTNPYGFIGDTLKLTCNVTDRSISGNVSGAMYFSKQFEDGERVVPLQYVRTLSTRSIRLEYPVRSGDEQGCYTCHLNTTDKQLRLGSQCATVDYRPETVQEIQCAVYNWEKMTCKWDLNTDYVNPELVTVQLVWAILNYSKEEFWKLRDGQWDCPHQNKTSCTWQSDEGKDSFQPGKMYYMTVIISTKNNDGKEVANSQSKVISIDTMNIVKPAPVQNLSVVDKNSTCISLAWNHSNTERNMMYRLYVRQGGHLKEYKSISERSKTVCELHPAWDYVLQVSCIPIPHGYRRTKGSFSDLTSLVATTLEDVPSSAPGLSPGSFRYEECPLHNHCNITIYWRPVPEDGCNGEITGYMVRQTNMESGHTEQEMLVNGTVRLAQLGAREDSKYVVQLQGATRIGFSQVSATIYIQPRIYRVPYPEELLVEGQQGSVRVSWQPPITRAHSPEGGWLGYTLFYCNGSKFTLKCLDELKWEALQSEDSWFSLSVEDDQLDTLLVGISAQMNVAGDVVSSGILWSHCIYSQEQKPPQMVDVKFSAIQPRNGLMLEWGRLDCSKYPVYISRYILTYCRANSQQGCAGPSENVTVQNTETSYEVKDLEAGVAYRLTMTAISKAGAGPESQPMIKEVVNSDLNTGEIIGLVLAGLFVFVLFVIVSICCIRKLRQLKKGFYMDVDIPPLPPLREGDPLHDMAHHYPGRPLPQPPISLTATGPDDGYSSADTDPICEASRYEPVTNKGKAGKNLTARNVSVSSETALLLSMEENCVREEPGKCHPYQVTPLGGLHSAALHTSKRHKRSPGVWAGSSCRLEGCGEDGSVDSYLRVGNSTDCTPTSTSCSSARPLLELGSASCTHNLTQPPFNQTQVGFVLIPPPLSDPPPPPSPPSAVTDNPTHEVSLHQPSTSVSYTSESALCELSENNTMHYSRIDNEGSETPPSNPDYVLQEQAHSPGVSMTPSMTSTPQTDLVRPLSEYMKHLPLSYYEEPHPDHQVGPTTEL